MEIVKWERVVPCGKTDRQRERHDETNIEFRSFANAHKNDKSKVSRVYQTKRT